jgi:hypothetical protein
MNRRRFFQHALPLSLAAGLCLLILTAGRAAQPALTTLKLENKSVAEVTKLLAELENVSIVIAGEAREKIVDLDIRGKTFTEILDALCDAAGLQWRCSDKGVYIIDSGGSGRRTTIVAGDTGGKEGNGRKGLTRAVIPLQFWDAADISYLFGGRDEPRNPLLKGDSLVSPSPYGIPGVHGITYVPDVALHQTMVAPNPQELLSRASQSPAERVTEEPKQYTSYATPGTTYAPPALAPTPGVTAEARGQYPTVGGPLGMLVPEGIEPPIVAYLPLNALIVRGEPDAIEEFRRIIRDFLDIKVPQVLVEVQIISVKLSTIQRYGIHWLWAGANTNVGFLSGTASSGDFVVGWTRGNLAAQMGASTSANRARVINAMRVAGFNNFTSTISFTSTFTAIVQSGVVQPGISGGQVVTGTQPIIIPVSNSLTVTPRINGDGSITIMAVPVLADVVGTTSVPGGGVMPNVDSRSLSALVRVKDGETVVLGGLTNRSMTKTKAKVPLLSEIPILGRLLFTETDQTVSDDEVFIFLTPRIIAEEAPGAPTAAIAP